MKFVVISDTHRKHKQLELPAGDILLHAGDFTSKGYSGEIEDFAKWLSKQPFEYKVIIPGNHDIMFENDWERACSFFDSDVHILDQTLCEIDGIRIWGEPRTPEFHPEYWVYNVPRSKMYEQCWSKVPENIDILLTHGPPHGCGDVCEDMHIDGRFIHVGCTKQRKFLSERDDIKAVFCGHVHEGYGRYRYANIDVYNASVCNLRYQVVNPPVVYELGSA